jgi:hypothetical protein
MLRNDMAARARVLYNTLTCDADLRQLGVVFDPRPFENQCFQAMLPTGALILQLHGHRGARLVVELAMPGENPYSEIRTYDSDQAVADELKRLCALNR